MSHSHPTLHDREKNACGICHKEVKETDKAIECDKCLTWIHIKCQKMTVKNTSSFRITQKKNLNAKIVINAKYAVK